MPPPQGGAEEVTSPPSSGPEGLATSRSLRVGSLAGAGGRVTEKGTSNTGSHQLG